MINLDNVEWSNFSHAYGEATDIPAMLQQLADYPDSPDYSTEPYFSLWSALCHQGDTCTAAYASVPHILALAKAEPKRINYQFILLPTSIEIARLQGRGPDIPSDMELDYFKAIRSMPAIISSLSKNQMDETMALVCAAAIAVAGGYGVLGEAILELEGESATEFLEWKSNL